MLEENKLLPTLGFLSFLKINFFMLTSFYLVIAIFFDLKKALTVLAIPS